MRFRILSVLAVLFIACSGAAQPHATGPDSPGGVPRLVKYGDVVRDGSGAPRRGTVGVTFAVYAEREGGSALWMETQNVELDEQGRYNVMLGAMTRDGLPSNLFGTGESRWLSVQVQLPGETEQARVLLVSVPYAMRAEDAASLGGRPATDYVLREHLTGWSGVLPVTPTTQEPPGGGGSKFVVSATGTVNFVPKATVVAGADVTYANSQIFDNGTNVGIGTVTPAGLLDISLTTNTNRNSLNTTVALNNSAPINGAVISALNMQLIDQSTASNLSKQSARMVYIRDAAATGGVLAFDTIFTTSAILNSNAPYQLRGANFEFPRVLAGRTLNNYIGLYLEGPPAGNGAVTSKFAMVTEPGAGNVGINTTNPLDALHVDGTVRVSGAGNGIRFSDGTLQTTAATGGSAGDVTSVTTAAGSGLQGGVASGDATLSLLASCSANQILKWTGTAWACATDNDTDTNSGGTVTSITAGNGLTGGTITAAGTLAVNFINSGGDFGTSNTVARGDHLHGGSYLGLMGGMLAGPLSGPSASFSNGSGSAVSGAATGSSGVTYGVLGTTNSGDGNSAGVKGVSNSIGFGVLGEGQIAVQGVGWLRGVSGFANAPFGENYGVEGHATASGDGVGVFGNGGLVGVRGQGTITSSSVGVEGIGKDAGLSGRSDLSAGYGGRFTNTDPAGKLIGAFSAGGPEVFSVSNSGTVTATAFVGDGSGLTNLAGNFLPLSGGILTGQLQGTTGLFNNPNLGVPAVHAISTETTFESWGVRGRTNSAAGLSAGVFGQSHNPAGGSGVLGTSSGSDGIGVQGLAQGAAGMTIGVRGVAIDAVQGVGVLGSGNEAGVWGIVNSASSNAAGGKFENRNAAGDILQGIDASLNKVFRVANDGTIHATSFNGGLRVTHPATGPLNLIAGPTTNSVAPGVMGATVAGGGAAPPTFICAGVYTGPNVVFDHFGVVAGGCSNRAGNPAGGLNDSSSATVSGGAENHALNVGSTIGGGGGNTAGGFGATISGGLTNTASAVETTVGGGRNNTASGAQSAILGGSFNSASGVHATVAGGSFNTASGLGSFVAGGLTNDALGTNAFAAGSQAKANHAGAFVWADAINVDLASTAANQFNARATGGFRLFTGTGATDQFQFLGNALIFPDGTSQATALTSNFNGTSGTFSGNVSAANLTLTGSLNGGLRIQGSPSAPNILAGHDTNSATGGAVGVTISGGGTAGQQHRVSDSFGTIGGGSGNQVGNNNADSSDSGNATVAGGQFNTASSYGASVGGGQSNTASGTWATVAGGTLNHASNFYSAVGGGIANTAGGESTVVSGGNNNNASGPFATIPGGVANLASGSHSLAAGRRAKATHDGAFVWGDATPADVVSSAANQFTARATGGFRFFTGTGASDQFQFIGNALIFPDGTSQSTALSSNFVGTSGTFSGGVSASNLTLAGAINGGFRVLPSTATPNVVGGYTGNTVNVGVVGATISGGGIDPAVCPAILGINDVTGSFGSIGGGCGNRAHAFATVAGGTGNHAAGQSSTVAGGLANLGLAFASAIGGGEGNATTGLYSTVAGGAQNTTTAQYSTVSGGNQNSALNPSATVPGGSLNVAQGWNSFAAGFRAKALHDGAFVWGDRSVADVSSTAANEFTARASGGFRLLAGAVQVGDVTNPAFPVAGNLFIENSSGDPLNSFRLDGFGNYLYIAANSAGGSLAGSGIAFRTSLAGGGEHDRMIIAPDGNVGIGVDPPAARLHVNGNILASGTITPSSRRYKTNILPMVGALGLVERMQGVSYTRKDDGTSDFGFIAEELGAVLPQLVLWEENGVDAKGLDYARLTPVLVEAVKEQQAQLRAKQAALESQQQKLTAQQGRIDSLERQLEEVRAALAQLAQQLTQQSATGDAASRGVAKLRPGVR